MSRPGRLWSAVLCLAWLAVGCAEAGTTVTSNADRGVASSGQRLLVVSRLAWIDRTWAEAFEKAMLSELRKIEATAAIQTRNPLALQIDKDRYAAQIAEFGPDLILVIEPRDGTVDERGRNRTRRFEAGLFRHFAERNRRELIWRATVTVEPSRDYIRPEDMPGLAGGLATRLIADGMLSKPRRTVVPRPVKTVYPSWPL